jgi:hypothetical protein
MELQARLELMAQPALSARPEQPVLTAQPARPVQQALPVQLDQQDLADQQVQQERRVILPLTQYAISKIQ